MTTLNTSSPARRRASPGFGALSRRDDCFGPLIERVLSNAQAGDLRGLAHLGGQLGAVASQKVKEIRQKRFEGLCRAVARGWDKGLQDPDGDLSDKEMADLEKFERSLRPGM